MEKKTWQEMTARERATALANRGSRPLRSYLKEEENRVSEVSEEEKRARERGVKRFLDEERERTDAYERQWTASELYERALARFHHLMPDKQPSARYEEVMRGFAKYFARETGGRLNPRKGIILSGCTGCGKTTLFKLFNFNYHWPCDRPEGSLSHKNTVLFSWNSCRYIAMKYTDKQNGGINALREYFGPQAAFFDDLGAENIASHFGTKVDVMGEIIQSRYDCKGALTFFTTNLTYEQIQQTYNERVASRLAEMCNWLDMGINEDYRR